MAINIELHQEALRHRLDVLGLPEQDAERIVDAFRAFWQGDIELQDLDTLAKRCHLPRMSLIAFSDFVKVRIQACAVIECFVLLGTTQKHMVRTFYADDDLTQDELDNIQVDAMSYYYNLVDTMMLKYLAEKSVKEFACVALSRHILKDRAGLSPDATQDESIIEAVKRPMDIRKAKIDFHKSSETIVGYQ